MSPEQASGDPVDGRSDLYSLGIICYEMLMGRVPFTTGTLRTILLHQIKDPPPPFSSVRPDRDVPRQLEDLVFAMLEKDPEYRPESAEVVLDALQAEATVRRTQFVRKRERPQKKRLALLALVCLTAGLSLEHFVPWRVFLFPQAEAEGRDSRSQYPGSPGDARVPVVPTAPEAPTNSSAVQPIRKATRLRCEVCGTFYKFGEKNGGMCHGLPLLDSE
jgi:serine/threonine protein kinase